MKKGGFILIVLLSALIIAAVAGCGSKVSGDEGKAGDTLSATVETAEAPEETESAVAGEMLPPGPEVTEEILSNSVSFSLDNRQNDIWTGEIAVGSGSYRDVLPVMTSDNGETLLADAYRKIVCVRDNGNGELVPCTVEDADNEVLLKFSSFIMIRDLFASDGWKEEGENTEPPEKLKETLSKVPFPPSNLYYIGDIGENHVFSFGGDSGDRDYKDLSTVFSKVFGSMEDSEYALIIG